MNSGARRELAVILGIASAALWLTGRKSASGLAGAAAGVCSLWPGETYTFRDKVVVITGGSRGLGLALAKALLSKGAKVSLLARDSDELARAADQLSSPDSVLPLTCDVTHPDALREAFRQTAERFGRIDILINNAGAIAVGPLETQTVQDFEALFRTQVFAVVTAVQEIRPYFRQIGGGRIANISSIGGKIPLPHLSSYSTAKFALAGLSQTMRAELAADNIRVTTVYPGLMRVGSGIQAVLKGDHESEYAWFTVGNHTPGVSVSSEHAAARILEGIANGDAEVLFPLATKIATLAHNTFPELSALAAQTAAALLPHCSSSEMMTGAQSQGWLLRQPWFRLFQAWTERLRESHNQVEKENAEFNLSKAR